MVVWIVKAGMLYDELYVNSVWSSEEKAEKAVEGYKLKDKEYDMEFDMDYIISRWEVDEFE